MKPLRQQFIDHLTLAGRAQRTITSYVHTVKALSQHYNCNPLLLSKEQIQDYLLFLSNERKFAPATINLTVGALKTFFNVFAPESAVMESVPRMKKANTLPLVLSREEVDKLIHSITNLKQRVIVMLLYSAGIRLSECVMLQPRHIESTRMKIRIEHAKGNKDRYTILADKTLTSLRDYFRAFRPSTWLFEGPGGKQYGRRTIGKIVTTAAKKAGINKNVTPHTLRHTFATHLMEAGVALPIIQKLLGHSNIKTTMVYLHVSEPMVDKIRSPFDDISGLQAGGKA
jgi:integrase/recombinase XerD